MRDIILPKQCELCESCFNTVEDYVLLCALKVIDSAMRETDENWFMDFKQHEETERKPIIKDKVDKEFKKPSDMDLQAAMKIFKFRREMFAPVFDKYNLPERDDSDYITLISSLINLRNDIIGHLDGDAVESKYADLDSKEALELIFKFRAGILEFISFLSYFPNEQNKKGESYLDMAKAEKQEMEKLLNVFQYSVEATIEREGLNMSVSRFEELCKRLHISYRSDDDGHSYFYTENYKKTIRAITVLVEEMEEPRIESVDVLVQDTVVEGEKQKKNNVIIASLAIIVVLLLVIVIILGGFDKEDKKDTPIKEPSKEVEEVIDVETDKEEQEEQEEIDKPAVTKMKGAGMLGGFVVTIDQIPSEYITFNFENDNSAAYSLGWVSSSEVVVITTDGEYYGQVFETHTKINKGASGSFHASFDTEFEGKIKKIIINNVLPLSDTGLPTEAGSSGLSLKIPMEYYED